MKSRLAILSMLVGGMLLSTTGAGLAVTGFTGNDASVAQYGAPGGEQGGSPAPGSPSPGSPSPTDNGGGPKGDTLDEGDQGGPAPATSGTPPTSSNSPTTTTLQPTRQVETGAASGDLPFTGFLAIPVLLGGLALLSLGLVLRRRSAADRS